MEKENNKIDSNGRKLRSYFILSIIFGFLLLLLSSCQEDQVITTATGSSENNLSAGFYSEGPAANNNMIQLTEAKFILRKMVLKYEHSSNECDVKLGPFVVNLDLNSKIVPVGIAKIPPAAYDEIKFQVHKPTPNDGITDPDFIESNSHRYSIVVKGYYNSVPFIYKSDITVAKEIEFEQAPITVNAVQVIYITIRINPYSWFTESGNVLDPAIESNSHMINENIKQSLRRAFRDMNCDGEPD